jgi:hypothetical protein
MEASEMGKYTKLRGKLPRLEAAPSWFRAGIEQWKARVDAEKRRILLENTANPEDANVSLFARLYADAKVEKHRLKQENSEVNVRVEALSQILRDILEGENLEKVEVAGGLSVGLRDEVYASVENEDKFFKYLERTGQTALIKMVVAPGTMKSLTSELLAAGRNPPDGIKPYIKTSAQLYGLKNGNGADDDE